MKKTWEEATIEEIENYCENNKTGLIIKDGKVTGEERTEGQKNSTRIQIGSRYECHIENTMIFLRLLQRRGKEIANESDKNKRGNHKSDRV